MTSKTEILKEFDRYLEPFDDLQLFSITIPGKWWFKCSKLDGKLTKDDLRNKFKSFVNAFPDDTVRFSIQSNGTFYFSCRVVLTKV